MNILIEKKGPIPALKYGGTQRVIYALGRALAKMGHNVTFLAGKGSYADFANIIEYDPDIPLNDQIPDDIDVVHFNSNLKENTIIQKPYIVTVHSNNNPYLDRNSVFVSQNHALRNKATSFVYNGLDWDDYDKPHLDSKRSYYHFLAKAAWRVKNVKGAISIINKVPGAELEVMGGTRLNFKMGFRFTLSPKIHFHGMVGEEEKSRVMNRSLGLLSPVRWHEPFGLMITESLYFGCPVFGTPYGALPELVKPEFGFLSDSKTDLVDHLKNRPDYSPKHCHEYAADLFNSRVMAEAYLKKYETVLSGKFLNDTDPVPVPQEKNLPFYD